jgi:hypothetical protein
MQARDPGFGKPQLVRKGIVAHSTVRVAAGASVVAASLLIVGPNPAQAVADKDGSGIFNNDYRKNGSSGRGDSGNRIVSNLVQDVLGIGGTGVGANDAKPDLAPQLMDLGTGGGDVEDLAVVNSFAVQDQTALRSAAVVEVPVGDNIAAAVPRTGSGYAGLPAMSFRSPRVTFGNGRTPGTHVPRQDPEAVYLRDTMDSPAAVPPAPAVPTAIEINFPPPPLPPIERIRSAELVVGEFGTGTTDTVTDPLAGVAGLFLIPAIGAVLGYRQARAAQSFRASLRT